MSSASTGRERTVVSLAHPRCNSTVIPSMPRTREHSRDTHTVFWTGGWDSTFRVLDLVLVRGVTVQPVYVTDPTRQSLHQELEALQIIRERVAARGAGDRLRPTVELLSTDVKASPAIQKKYERLRETRDIGVQYGWLAQLVEAHDLHGIEVCVQHNEDFYFLYGDSAPTTCAYAREPLRPAIPENCPESLFNVFSFPTLAIGKREMRAYALENGFLPVLEESWFCHMPTRRGKPCGYCVPCRMTIDKGLGYRLPQRARLANHMVRFFERPFMPWRARKRVKELLRTM